MQQRGAMGMVLALAGLLAMAAAADTAGEGASLLFVYSLGLGLPFLIAGLATEKTLALLSKHGKLLRRGELVCAAILGLAGILVFLDKFSALERLLSF